MSRPDPESLIARVRAVAARAQFWRWVYALAAVAIWIFGAILVAVVADYFLRSEEVGMRVLSSLFVVAAGVGAAIYYVGPLWRHQERDADIAARIERHFPELGNSLTSALDFLATAEDDPRAGSPTMRRAVIAEAEARVNHLPLQEVIDPWLPQRALGLAGGSLLLLLALSAFDIGGALQGAQRLLIPWNAPHWPREHELAFVDAPHVHAAGRDLELVLTELQGLALPSVVEVQYLWSGESTIRQRRFDGVSGKELPVVLPQVNRSMKYRAIGGDHLDMPWIELEVVDAPQLSDLEVRLTPPAYTGWKPETTSGRIRALEGTTAEVTGRSSRQLAQTAVRVEANGKTRIQGTLDPDGHQFRVPGAGSNWKLTASGSWQLEVMDALLASGGRELAVGDTRYELQVVSDKPPTVDLEWPAGPLYVTPQARLPIRVRAEDALAIRRVELRFTRSDASDREAPPVILWEGPAEVSPERAKVGFGGEENPEVRSVTFTWDLSKLPNLASGKEINFFAAAVDYKPTLGQSSARRLTIVDADQLEERLSQRQTTILAQLQEALKAQRQARLLAAALSGQLREARTLGAQDVNQLQGVDLQQREVQRILIVRDDSLAPQLAALLEELKVNRLDRPELERRWTQLLAEIRRLGKEPLPKIDEQLAATLLGSQRFVADVAPGSVSPAQLERLEKEIASPLRSVVGNQAEVISSLEKLIAELSQWDNYRRFGRELSQLRRDQEQIQANTRDLHQATLASEGKDLTPQQQADLRVAAEQQRDLAQNLERIQSQMERMSASLRETDPLVADTLADALELSRRSALSARMRDSGLKLDQQQLGQADQLQGEVLAGLQEVLDSLSNRREHELERLKDKLNEAAGELEQLRAREESLRRAIENAKKQPDEARRQETLQKLKKQEEQLAEEVRRLARRLQRLQAEGAEQAAQALERGAAAGEKAGEAAAQGDTEQALEQGKQAAKDLEDAQKKISQAIRQVERDLAQQQLAKLEQLLEGMIKRQEGLLGESKRLAGDASAPREWTPGQLISLRDAGRAQRALASETTEFAKKIEQATVFHAGLEEASKRMHRAAEGLTGRDPGAETQAEQDRALQRLMLVREALKTDSGMENPEDPMNGGEGGDTPPQNEGQDGITNLAELKLLKLWQEAVLARTRELGDKQKGGGQLKPEEQRELAELAVEQGRLAAMVVDLSKPADNRPEDELPERKVEPKPEVKPEPKQPDDASKQDEGK